MTWGFGVVGVENLRFCIEKSNIDENEELFRVYITLEMEEKLSECIDRQWRNKFSSGTEEVAWMLPKVTQQWYDKRRTKTNWMIEEQGDFISADVLVHKSA